MLLGHCQRRQELPQSRTTCRQVFALAGRRVLHVRFQAVVTGSAGAGMVAAYRFGHGLLEADMLDRIDQQLGTMRNAANLRAYRQEVLASNIANADTPNYKARDFDFKAALENAKAGRAGFAIARTSPRHLSGENLNGVGSAPAGVDVLYRTEYQANADGNTVNMDVERSAFAENAVQIEAALTFIRGQLAKLQTAITGQ